MTQTPSRDWKKDMEIIINTKNFLERHGCTTEGEDAAIYWLQEANTLQNKLKEMAEIIEYEAVLTDLRGAEMHARELRAMVATLYPDTPAPTPKIGLYDTVTHSEYGSGGVMEIIGTKARISFDDLDYDLTLEISELTPAPTPTKTRHVCFNCDGEKTFVCYHEDQGPTIEPCEICNGEGTLLYDEEQLKHLLPDAAPKEGE